MESHTSLAGPTVHPPLPSSRTVGVPHGELTEEGKGQEQAVFSGGLGRVFRWGLLSRMWMRTSYKLLGQGNAQFTKTVPWGKNSFDEGWDSMGLLAW